MPEPSVDFDRLLRELAARGVEFVVVGGVAAFLQGAPLVTLDLDIVHRRTRENILRLLDALEGLDARYRAVFGEPLRPRYSHLSSAGHQLLTTSSGPLDVLGAIGRGETYEELIPNCIDLQISGMVVKVLHLAELIRIKELLGHPKDRAVLEILKETLRTSAEAGS